MDVAEKYRACVEALREFMQGAGFTDVVIGLSGGIDSAVTAVMCVDAVGANHVHGVLLPGPYSSDHSREDALELAANLGISTETISICEPYAAFERALGSACGGALEGLPAENTQARCRMVALMALSNAHGWMLVNTGNKSESCMGYSTLYGDTAGAFAPLGGLYKTDVYAVGRWRNGSSSGPIPERTFTKPPSAELAPDQQDEKSMGVDYATLDRILEAHVERGMTAEEVARQGFDVDLCRSIVRRTASYAFKRAQEPPYPQAKFY
ncbi:MAG: NAD(+) synthase [Eggerthellaceae bacterium]|nr:NAD(+) synthase [Eggerthellaceae bacterium]